VSGRVFFPRALLGWIFLSQKFGWVFSWRNFLVGCWVFLFPRIIGGDWVFSIGGTLVGVRFFSEEFLVAKVFFSWRNFW
jgi:hypothetical protein